jgi:hypothetical protein
VPLKQTNLGILLPPRKQVGVVLTGSNKHNGRLGQVECVYELVHSAGAAVASEDHGIVLRCVNCISENVPCLMSTTIQQTSSSSSSSSSSSRVLSPAMCCYVVSSEEHTDSIFRAKKAKEKEK